MNKYYFYISISVMRVAADISFVYFVDLFRPLQLDKDCRLQQQDRLS